MGLFRLVGCIFSQPVTSTAPCGVWVCLLIDAQLPSAGLYSIVLGSTLSP